MLEGENFLVLGEQWGYYPSTTEHLLRHLIRHNRFFWVHEMGCRAPEWNRYTLQRAWGKLVGSFASNGNTSGENAVITYSPPVFPLRPIRPVRWWNKRVMTRGINRRLKECGIQKPIFFTMSPIGAEIIDDLDAKLTVYYIVDNYEEMPNWYRDYVRELELRMMARADLVFATSQPLVEAKARLGRRPILLPQGVDFEHFHHPVVNRAPAPEELARIPSPRILFMGIIAPWVDVDLLAEIAKSYPKASLVLLGPVRTDVGRLRQEPNVHFLGQRPYEEIPAYLANCDAAIIPFRQNALTRYVNPLKLLEYMAAGLPVVSTWLPHLSRFDGLIYCAQSSDEFISQVGRALADFSAERRAQCVAAAQENRWERRTEQLSEILRERCAAIASR